MAKPVFGPCDSYQLEPFTYPEAWDRYKRMRKNEWSPEQIGVAEDVACFRSPDTPSYSIDAFLAVMAQLTVFDLKRGLDAAETFMNIVQPAEIKAALTRMVFEEMGHTESYRYIIENFGLPVTGEDNFYDTWKRVPVMQKRVEMAEEISEPLIHIATEMAMTREPPNRVQRQAFLRATFFWFQIFEGIWFWLNLLGPVQAMSDLGLFVKAAEQFRYIARDESQHIALGIDLWGWVVREDPSLVDQDLIDTIRKDMEKAIDLEQEFILYVLRNGTVLGYDAVRHVETAKWFANHRLWAHGLPKLYENPQHHFQELFARKMEINQEANFFETHVKEYQTGSGLDFDDSDDPGEEDGPWAAGWNERSGL